LAYVIGLADPAFDRGDYTASLQALAKLRVSVDKFFAEVMVNTEDHELRANRLGLLMQLHQAMNRVADRSFDSENPRTATRELVTGAVSPAAAWALLVGSSAAFVAAAALISPLTGWLSLPVLAILLGYSYAKRFTWGCHLWLGVAQALGPIGVAIALTGRAPGAALLLAPSRRQGSHVLVP
jgi:hypothetical protein